MTPHAAAAHAATELVQPKAQADGAAAPLRALPAVAAAAVARRYGDGESAVDALRGVTFEVAAGQFVAVMGPSGSGKSTLMHLLAGLDRPTAGSVHVGGEDITAMADKQLTKLRRRHIGFVFQQFNLLPTLTAEENITLPLAIARSKRDRAEIDALIERVGLGERRGHRPAQLSGGQQQRVAIARALVSEPTVLFADEPTGNLDSTSGADVLALLREAVERDGQTTVMVTHDPRAAASADRVVFLADGRIVGDLAQPTEDAILAAMKDASR
jgi:putative ABC transport system ATP-binding protein